MTRVAAGEASDELVDVESVIGAIRLAEYFKCHAQRVHEGIATPHERALEQVVAWLRSKGGEGSVRDLLRSRVAGVTSVREANVLVEELEARELGSLRKEPRGRRIFALAESVVTHRQIADL